MDSYSFLLYKNQKNTIKIICFTFLLFFISCNQSNQYKDIGKWVELKEGENIECYHKIHNKIYGYYGDESYFKHIERSPLDVDAKTFRVCQGTKYAKDKDHVYYPIQIRCEDGDEYGGCFLTEYVVDGLISTSFKYIGNEYGTDGEKIFYKGKKISWKEYESAGQVFDSSLSDK